MDNEEVRTVMMVMIGMQKNMDDAEEYGRGRFEHVMEVARPPVSVLVGTQGLSAIIIG